MGRSVQGKLPLARLQIKNENFDIRYIYTGSEDIMMMKMWFDPTNLVSAETAAAMGCAILRDTPEPEI